MYTDSPDFRAGAVSRRAPRYPILLTQSALEEIFSACADFQKRSLLLGLDPDKRVTVFWIDGLVS